MEEAPNEQDAHEMVRDDRPIYSQYYLRVELEGRVGHR